MAMTAATPMSPAVPPLAPTERHRRFTDEELRTVSRWQRRWRSWAVVQTQCDPEQAVDRRGPWFLSIMSPPGFWGRPDCYDYEPWGYDVVATEGDSVQLIEPDGVQSAVFPNLAAALNEIREMPGVVRKSARRNLQAV